MLILGIDPGLRITGYGCVKVDGPALKLVEAGVVKSTGAGALAPRLAELSAGLEQVIESTEPDVMVVEALYSHYKHPRTSILMGHARGVLLLAAAKKNVEVIDYPATRIKKALTGNGRASKAQVQNTVASALKLKEAPEPPDVADALAAAMCHANVLRHEKMMGKNTRP